MQILLRTQNTCTSKSYIYICMYTHTHVVIVINVTDKLLHHLKNIKIRNKILQKMTLISPLHYHYMYDKKKKLFKSPNK